MSRRHARHQTPRHQTPRHQTPSDKAPSDKAPSHETLHRGPLARAALALVALLIVAPLPSTGHAQEGGVSTPPPADGAGGAGSGQAGSGPAGSGAADGGAAQDAGPAGAAAQPRSYRVDPAGGPLTLEERVAAAAAAWAEAAPGVAVLHEDPDAPSAIAYGDPDLLGPDTLSLSRQSSATGLRIELAPSAALDHAMVLLHELGVILGLPEGAQSVAGGPTTAGGTGVMAFAVPTGGGPTAPTPADVAALRAARTYAPEDLTHDGAVDFYDLVAFGQAYGRQGVNLPADFNGDGRVDDADLGILEQAYTFGPPAPETPAASGAAGTSDGATPGASGGPGAAPEVPAQPDVPDTSGAPGPASPPQP